MGAQYRPQAVDLAAALVALSGACLTNLLHGSFTVTSSPGLSPDSVSLPHPQRGKPETLSVILYLYYTKRSAEILSAFFVKMRKFLCFQACFHTENG